MMPSLKDLAVVSLSSGTPEALRAAVNGSADGDLITSSWLAHQYMLGEAQRRHAAEIPGAEPGATWLLWEGTMAGVLIELQLAKPKDMAALTELRRAISAHLRHLGNAVCVKHGPSVNGKNTVTQWGIRTEYREVPPASVVPILEQTKPSSRRVAQPAPPASAPAPAPAPAAATAERPSDITCGVCGTAYNVMHIGRHVFRTHGDPVPALLSIIKKRGMVSRADLAEYLSQAAFGGVVNVNYVARLLRPATEEKPPLIRFHKGWAADCYYEWLGGTTSPSQPAKPAPELSRKDDSVHPALAQPGSRSAVRPAPLPRTTLAVPSPSAAAALAPVTTPPVPPAPPHTAPASPAASASSAEPSLALEIGELLDAFSRHTSAYVREIKSRVTSLEAAAAKATATAGELEELEALRKWKKGIIAAMGIDG